MPVLEVEIADDGSIGTLPDALQTFMNKRIAEAKRKATDTTEDKLKPYLSLTRSKWNACVSGTSRWPTSN